MTAVLGLRHGRRVWLASDRGIGDDFEVVPIAHPKISRCAGGGIGYAGDLGTAQLLAPVITEQLATGRTPSEALRTALVRTSPDGECDFLLAWRGRLYNLSTDGSTVKYAQHTAAIGSGGHAALGALRATSGDPVKRLRASLRIASSFIPTLLRPFDVIEVSA